MDCGSARVGTIASAISMGTGAYLAAKSEREVHEAEIQREKFELETDPESEREELELFYQLKGFTEDESKTLVEKLSARPEQFMKTMAAVSMGWNSTRKGSICFLGFLGSRDSYT